MVSWGGLEEHCQWVGAGDPAPLLSSGEALFGVLCPLLGCSVHERCGAPGVNPMECHEDDEGDLNYEERLRSWAYLKNDLRGDD